MLCTVVKRTIINASTAILFVHIKLQLHSSLSLSPPPSLFFSCTLLILNQLASSSTLQTMATVDFYCSEHSIPQLMTHTIPSPSTSAALPYSSPRHHSISTKLTMDPRRLGIFLEQEQHFQPNSYHMHKNVDECERMQLLEAVLQMEVCPCGVYNCC